MIISLLLHPAAVLLSSNVLMFAIVYRFICIIVAIYVHHLGLYCVLFRRVLIYEIDVALQLTKL